MAISEDQLRSLRSILDALQHAPDRPPVDQPFMTVGYGEDSWSIIGEPFVIFKRLAGQLASSALGGAGLSVKEAEDILITACSQSFRGAPEPAIKALNERLEAPPRRYRVARPFSAYYAGDRFQIGSGTVVRGLPEEVLAHHEMLEDDFPALSLTVQVEARDERTAAVLADQEIGEVAAILQLYDVDGVPDLGEASVTIRDDGTWLSTPGTQRRLHLDRAVGRDGALHHYAASLANAQSTPYAERTDWQRRCVNACRWLMTSRTTPWPSLSLVSLFVALEALFVESTRRDIKKTIIADRWSERFAKPEHRAAAKQSLIELYNRRNDTAHQALDYRDELEIERLTRRVERAIFWATAHLMPDHNQRRGPCSTIEQVIECDARILV